MKDIIIHLQGQVIANLKVQWQQDIYVDFTALQDVSDDTQDKAILTLLQLQQRIITSAPIEDLKPPPLFSYPRTYSSPPQQPPVQQITMPAEPSTPIEQYPAPPAYKPVASPTKSASVVHMSAEKKKPFISVTKISFFGKRSKSEHYSKKPLDELVEPVEPVESKTTTPVVPKPPIPAISKYRFTEINRLPDAGHKPTTAAVEMPAHDSRLKLVDTASSGVLPLGQDLLEYNPWTVPRPPSPAQRSQISMSAPSHSRYPSSALDTGFSSISVSNLSVSNLPISPRDLLPSEANKFAGFCKGAWRLQIGDKKKAVEERQRPGGMYTANSYWQCSKCKFEGQAVVLNKKRKSFNRRVMMTEGVQFRWEFLFKSHIESKDGASDPMKATFGCIFCCAEGKGTPTFGGIHSFMTHLQDHRDRLPTGEVLYRMNCLAGRRAEQDEDFDVNLISRIEEEV